jgi:hypothetical protein
MVAIVVAAALVLYVLGGEREREREREMRGAMMEGKNGGGGIL